MTDTQAEALGPEALRIDAVGQVLMRLIARLDSDGVIDGPRFSRGLRTYAEKRAVEHGVETSGETILWMVEKIDEARAARQALEPR